MTRTLEKTGRAVAVEGGPLPTVHPLIAWWADQTTQASRLVTDACLFPVLATLQHARLACTVASAFGAVAAARQNRYWERIETLFRPGSPSKGAGGVSQQPSTVPGMTRSDLEELRSAMRELEEAKTREAKLLEHEAELLALVRAQQEAQQRLLEQGRQPKSFVTRMITSWRRLPASEPAQP